MFHHSDKFAAQRIIKRTQSRIFGDDGAVQKISNELSAVSGRVLDVGAGAGNLIPYLPKKIEYVALEPNKHLQSVLSVAAKGAGFLKNEVVQAGLEAIPFADETFDVVISVRALCAPKDLQKSLAEIKRVLKKGSRLIFSDHVAAPRKSFLFALQRGAQFFMGCSPARDIESAIKNAGFESVDCQAYKMKGGPSIAKNRIYGIAVK